MALSDIKNSILTASKSTEICETLHDVIIAPTEDDLIASGLPLALWAYQTGIVTDALLADFDEAKLNAAGIYSTGTFTITDPDKEIFILKEAVVTVNLNGTTRVKVNCMGAAALTLNTNDSSYCNLKLYDVCTASIAQADDSIVVSETKSSSSLVIVLNTASIHQIYARGKAPVTLIANDTSYCLARMYLDSTLDYTLTGTAQFSGEASQNAVITNSTP